MKIFELFDMKVPWEWGDDDDYTLNDASSYATFTIRDKNYRVMVEYNTLPIYLKDRTITKFYQVEFLLEIKNSRNKFGIENVGDALPVFATVLEILQDFFKNAPSRTVIVFSATESSRKKLYSTMTKRFASHDYIVYEGQVDGSVIQSSDAFNFDEYLYIIIKP